MWSRGIEHRPGEELSSMGGGCGGSRHPCLGGTTERAGEWRRRGRETVGEGIRLGPLGGRREQLAAPLSLGFGREGCRVSILMG